MHRQLWIDPATYLPVRMTASGTTVSYEIDYRWIPRTPASVAALVAPVPAGFTPVAVLPG